MEALCTCMRLVMVSVANSLEVASSSSDRLVKSWPLNCAVFLLFFFFAFAGRSRRWPIMCSVFADYFFDFDSVSRAVWIRFLLQLTLFYFAKIFYWNNNQKFVVLTEKISISCRQKPRNNLKSHMYQYLVLNYPW